MKNFLSLSTSKLKLPFLVVCFFISSTFSARAWGPEGHTIVGKVAMSLLTPAAKNQVLQLLNGMSIDTAANWMDIMRSNSDYDFMKPWHYVDYGKEESYPAVNQDQIVNKITAVIKELQHKKLLCSDQVKMDVLYLFHLIGDLHQPLHTGYDSDLGGNKIKIEYDTLKANLHSFWDEYVLSLNKINLETVVAFYNSNGKSELDKINAINAELWMSETRSLLPLVYDYEGYILSKSYVVKQKTIVEKQLVLAGIRLAQVLNSLFVQEAENLDFDEVALKYKNGINAKKAAEYVGKNVTACGNVNAVKETSSSVFINMGSKYPKSELTLVIFKKDRDNFPADIESFLKGKNIAVNGEVELYKDKVEIKITKQSDIIFL